MILPSLENLTHEAGTLEQCLWRNPITRKPIKPIKSMAFHVPNNRDAFADSPPTSTAHRNVLNTWDGNRQLRCVWERKRGDTHTVCCYLLSPNSYQWQILSAVTEIEIHRVFCLKRDRHKFWMYCSGSKKRPNLSVPLRIPLNFDVSRKKVLLRRQLCWLLTYHYSGD